MGFDKHNTADTYLDSWGYGDRWYGGCARYRTPAEIRDTLAPLLETMSELDTLRRRLQEEGGQVSDLDRVTQLLQKKVVLRDGRYKQPVALVDQEAVLKAVRDIGDRRVRFTVRQLESRMPVYYVCRLWSDYWSGYGLVVEDLHCSPDYPMEDERFVRLLDYGHETYFLRLSQFRGPARELMEEDGPVTDRDVDWLLYDLGRYIFQAAWHEDQRPGLLIAQHFRMPVFRRAIELLYLCLSGDLCELRNVADARMRHAFERLYPLSGIGRLLRRLEQLSGSEIADISRRALGLYAYLGRAFGKFLKVEVPWQGKAAGKGVPARTTPFYKLVFANMSRLDRVHRATARDEGLRRAAASLRRASRRVIKEITNAEEDVSVASGV